MNKKILIFVLLVSVLALTACGSGTASTPTSSNATKISTETQLAIGTLKLENTVDAVDAKTASQLLPSWQLLLELKSNASASPEETASVIELIQNTMTTQQTQAIKDMQLTQQDALTLMQERGLTGNTDTSKSSANSSTGGANNAVPIGGGGPPPDGAGIPLGNFNSQSGNGSQTSQGSTASSSTLLIEEVIRLLEQKIQA